MTELDYSRPAAGAPPAGAWRRGVVQDVVPPGMLDLGPGYLGPDLLPVDLLRAATGGAFTKYGAAALSYGHNPGADPLRQTIAARSTIAERVNCPVDGVLITAGTSMGLHLLSTVLATPGDVVLLPELSYDFATQIFVDDGLVPIRIAGDPLGLDPAALIDRVGQVRARGQQVAFVYLNPTFTNPTTSTIPVSRRREILAAAAALDVLIVEDDAYVELSLDSTDLPTSMAALAEYCGVIRLGTFAKTLGAGLRLGWIATEPLLAARLAGHGLFASGGSVNHTTSLTVATVLAGSTYDRHLNTLRHRLRLRRDAVLTGLAAGLGDLARVRPPAGGLFVWVELPAYSDGHQALAAATQVGVRVTAGSRFGRVAVPSVRISFSLVAPADLDDAVERLVLAWRNR